MVGGLRINEAPMDPSSVITQVSAVPANAENAVNNDTSGGSSGQISASAASAGSPTSVPPSGSSNSQLQASTKGKMSSNDPNGKVVTKFTIWEVVAVVEVLDVLRLEVRQRRQAAILITSLGFHCKGEDGGGVRHVHGCRPNALTKQQRWRFTTWRARNEMIV